MKNLLTVETEADDERTMTKVLRGRCNGSQKALVKRAARLVSLKEADIIRIGSTRYAAELLYRGPSLHAAV